MNRNIDRAVFANVKSARDWLMHEQSLFRSMDLEAIKVVKGEVVFSVKIPEPFRESDGGAHSAFSTIVMDSIFGLAVFTALDNMRPLATINIRIDPIQRPRYGERLICSARCEPIIDDVARVVGSLAEEKSRIKIAEGAGAFILQNPMVNKAL